MAMAKLIPYPFELLTDRLTIRSPAIGDAPQLREAIAESIEDLKHWMPWADHVPTPAEAKRNCARAARNFRNGTDFRLHLFLKETGVFVGGSGFHRVVWSIPKFEIGYWIRQSCRDKGYVTEAVEEIARFAFDRLGVKRVEIRTSARNIKSWRVAERLGFTLEGVLRNDERHADGSLRDTKIYSKIAQERGTRTFKETTNR